MPIPPSMAASLRRVVATALVGASCAASLAAQETTRASVDSSGTEANGRSVTGPSISADGRFVAFVSTASNLVPGDTNGMWDVFVHDRFTGVTERVSLDTNGGEADGDSWFASISADGNCVAFCSYATNLVPNDTNGFGDVFVYDRQAATTERVSVSTRGSQANGESLQGWPSISADGQTVAFVSFATNLVGGDTNFQGDVFVRDRVNGTTERVSVSSSGVEGDDLSTTPSISADGRCVAFTGYATNLVAGDTNGVVDAFVHDRSTGITERVSVDSSGVEGDSRSWEPSISGDGRFVAFPSNSTNLVAGDTNGVNDIFVHDRATGSTELVSVDSSGAQADSHSEDAWISDDGQNVAFLSYASNLVGGETNYDLDIFVHDRSTGRTELASGTSTGGEGDKSCDWADISADGRCVIFLSDSTNLVSGDTNGCTDVFVHERCDVEADWTNYGSGLPGTNGVPSFTSESFPVLGTTTLLDIANSYGKPTLALLFVGFQRASMHSSLGGDLLVNFAFTSLLAVPKDGAALNFAIPSDAQLCGFVIDLQAWESDPGATKGVAFTQGLELLLGH